MAASVEIHVYNGDPIADAGALVSGIDLISADNADNTPANRIAHPLTIGQRSYEKWLKPHVSVDPDNWIGQFKVWGDGAVDANTQLLYGTTAVGVAPTINPSSVAVNDFTTAVVGTKATWDLNIKTPAQLALDNTFRYLVLQLSVGASATPGDWTTETIYYEYQEA